jgi:(p)ppGpp synthase/HD superfamily hydrolase
MDEVKRADIFAMQAHEAVGQRRKYTNEAYYFHPQAVAAMVAAIPGATPAMIAAAHLHDVLEDTRVTEQEMRQEFGDEITDLVLWLTNVSRPEDGNRAVRKAVDRAHTAAAPGAAQTIKCCDIAHNIDSVAQHDPAFARVYVVEKRAQIEVLTRAHPMALARAVEAVERAERMLSN